MLYAVFILPHINFLPKQYKSVQHLGGDSIGKQTKALYNQLIGLINQQINKPAQVNEPQKFLTDKAMQAAKDMETNDFSTMPKNMFFNFQRPAEQKKQYEMLANASQTGTFGLADNGGASKSTQIQTGYMKDKFARDAAQNFQDNIGAGAASVQNALGQASGAEMQRIGMDDNRMNGIISQLSNLYQFKKQANSQGGMLGGILGMAGQLGSAAITKW